MSGKTVTLRADFFRGKQKLTTTTLVLNVRS